MTADQPSVLVVDDSATFRRYLCLTFSRASWLVDEWDPQSAGIEFVDRLSIENLTAVVADWQLGAPFSGLEVLTAIRKRNRDIACVLYSACPFEDEWRMMKESAVPLRIRVLDAGHVSPHLVHDAVVDEVKRVDQHFAEPRQVWQDYEPWIVPESHDQRLRNAVDAVGKNHLIPIIQSLFPERGPDRPLSYGFLKSGFSGARVFHLKDPADTPIQGPRYILKVAHGNDGFEALQRERRGFHNLILGGGRGESKLVGFVAEELRPASDYSEPASADDAWFGIAYREIGNGAGRVLPFRELYLNELWLDDGSTRASQIEHFLSRLYTDCLGHWFHHAARTVRRKLWGNPPEEEACYGLPASKQIEIFAALDELHPRARALLDRRLGPHTADRLIDSVATFIRTGYAGGPYDAPTLFERTFNTLEAGTHGDLHAGNVLAIEREGTVDPFLIDFTEFRQRGHPFYDYARMENDIRLRLMNGEDGSDILDELLDHWIRHEDGLWTAAERGWQAALQSQSSASLALADKAYSLMGTLRALAYQNLTFRLQDQRMKPTKDGFSMQYTAALLHRTLLSLASTDIVVHKKILALWLSAQLISRLGTLLRLVA